MDALIKPKNSLSLHLEVNKIIQKLTMIIKEIPRWEALKQNQDLTLYVLNLVSSLVKNKSISVSSIASKVLCDLFQLNTDETETLNSQISFLVDSGHVQKLSKSYLLFLKMKKIAFGSFFKKD